jgi:hypothetical protein
MSGDISGDGRNNSVTSQLLHEQIQEVRGIRHNDGLEIHNSLLNVVLYDSPQKGEDSSKARAAKLD